MAAALARLAKSPPMLRPERPADAAAIEAVVARAFGPGRYAKVSQRVREIAEPRPDLSFVAELDGEVAGIVRLSVIEVGGEPVAFLGPIAVDRARRSAGLGARLVQASLDAAEAAGLGSVLLVGDAPWFAPFGFERARDVVLPGPVDPARVLARAIRGRPLRGPVTAPRATKPPASAR